MAMKQVVGMNVPVGYVAMAVDMLMDQINPERRIPLSE